MEDSTISQRVTVLLLKKMGLNVDVAANGQEAMEMIRHFDYHLVLMDCLMPMLDGYTTSRQIPIIALTANAMSGDEEKCQDAGMDDVLSKPVKLETLQNKLRQWLK